MAQIKTSSRKSYSTSIYNGFKGCDFSSDLTSISRQRSPDSVNMISDNGGQIVKRCGWDLISVSQFHNVKKLIPYSVNVEGVGIQECIAVVTDTDISVLVYPATVASQVHFMQGKFLCVPASDGLDVAQLTDSGELNFYHFGTTVEQLSEAHIPLVITAATPDGGGLSYEPVNILSPKCKIDYICNGSTTAYTIPDNGNEVLTVERTYYELGEEKTYTYSSSEYEVTGRIITFNEAPPKPDLDGTPNLTVTYKRKKFEPEKIFDNDFFYTYTEGTSFRYFIIEKNSNIVRYSEMNEPFYWGDLNYINVGAPSKRCMGLLPINGSLAVVKEKSGIEGSLFFIQQEVLTDNIITELDNGKTQTEQVQRYVYKVSPSVAGIGAINPNTFAVLGDEPLYLSDEGIIGVASMATQTERTLQNRSYFLDGKLLKEPNLEKAVACVHKGYYLLFVNSHVYVLDGRQKATVQNRQVYEGYYWDNVPASHVCSTGKHLLFIDDNGLASMFQEGYYKNGDGIESVKAYWTTPSDADGAPQYLKTMKRKGSSIIFSDDTKSARVFAVKDEDTINYIGNAEVNGATVTFDQLTQVNDSDLEETLKNMKLDDSKIEYFTGKKVKKYHRLKLCIANFKNEPFGLQQITKTFDTVKYAKK